MASLGQDFPKIDTGGLRDPMQGYVPGSADAPQESLADLSNWINNELGLNKAPVKKKPWIFQEANITRVLPFVAFAGAALLGYYLVRKK